MPRCIFCNKFSFFTLDKGVCKSCLIFYENDANRKVADINKLLDSIDNDDIPLETKNTLLFKTNSLFDSLIKSNTGKAIMMFDSMVIDNLRIDIHETERKVDEMLERTRYKAKQKEILYEKKRNNPCYHDEDNYAIKRIEVKESYSSKIGFKRKYNKINGTPNHYIVFDLETTGLNNTEDEIIEIGAIKYINNTESERFQSYINPHRSIPRAASAVNHITQSKVKNAPDIQDVLIDFLVFIGDYPLLAYNSDFDMGFLQGKCITQFGEPIENEVIDVWALAKKHIFSLPDLKLETLKNHFNLKVKSHNALDDCFVTNYVYQYCKPSEELNFKYAIPFSYSARELTEKEENYVSKIADIWNKLKYASSLEMTTNSRMICINNGNIFIIGLKLYGKLQYIVLNIPYEQFLKKYNINIECAKSPKSEGDYTRLFVNDPEQLESITDYFRNRNKL